MGSDTSTIEHRPSKTAMGVAPASRAPVSHWSGIAPKSPSDIRVYLEYGKIPLKYLFGLCDLAGGGCENFLEDTSSRA